jgi:hypothetical protein
MDSEVPEQYFSTLAAYRVESAGKLKKSTDAVGHQWLTPVILATQEAEFEPQYCKKKKKPPSNLNEQYHLETTIPQCQSVWGRTKGSRCVVATAVLPHGSQGAVSRISQNQ